MVERQHKDLKNALRCRFLAGDRGWHTELPWVLMGLRNKFKPDLGASMAEMTFGSMMTIPGDLLGAPMQAELSQKKQRNYSFNNRPTAGRRNLTATEGFQLCTTPRLQRTQQTYTLKGRNTRQAHLAEASKGPFPITRRIGARQLAIQVGFTAKGKRRLEIQYIDQCKILVVNLA